MMGDSDASFQGDVAVGSDDDTKSHCCCWKVSAISPETALLLTFGSNLLFTCSQCVGAYWSNSLALYGDSVDMAVDTATYGTNLWVERLRSQEKEKSQGLRSQEKDKSQARCVSFDTCELSVSLASASVLIFTTMILLHEGWQRLQHSEEEEEEPIYVMVFAWICLAMDLWQLTMFALAMRLHEGASVTTSANQNLNLVSALVHVVADTLRTVAELVGSHLAVFGGVDAVRSDAVSSFVVNGIVLVSGLWLVCKVFRKWDHGYGAIKVHEQETDPLLEQSLVSHSPGDSLMAHDSAPETSSSEELL